jgi:hypothetical protein
MRAPRQLRITAAAVAAAAALVALSAGQAGAATFGVPEAGQSIASPDPGEEFTVGDTVWQVSSHAILVERLDDNPTNKWHWRANNANTNNLYQAGKSHGWRWDPLQVGDTFPDAINDIGVPGPAVPPPGWYAVNATTWFQQTGQGEQQAGQSTCPFKVNPKS